jgi:hypothetical protein
MLHASLVYAKGLCLIALAPVALGVPLYLLSASHRRWLPDWRPDRGTMPSSRLQPEAVEVR